MPSNFYLKLRSNEDLKYLLTELPKVNKVTAEEMAQFVPYDKILEIFEPSKVWMYIESNDPTDLLGFAYRFDNIPEPKHPTNSPAHFIEMIRLLTTNL